MRLFRVCPREESPRAFEGTDAPGRWSEAGTRLIYASESRSLATLEHAVHVEDAATETDLVAAEALLPDDVAVERVSPEALPPGWDAPEHLPELRRLGTDWVASGRTAVLRVPSAVVLGDWNILVNPAHPDAARLAVQALEPFRLDPRLPRRRPRPQPRSPIADGSERRLEPQVVRVQRIAGLVTVGVAALVLLGGLGIASLAADPPARWMALGLGAWLALVSGLAAVALVWPALAWSRTSFRVDERGLEIRRGVWWREVLRVPRSRVQHTDVSQGPVERPYGLATLVVHTAGTQHASIHLDGLAHETAEAVRDHLIAGAEDAV
jgi:membrane protein YdbS with pleckstrin-like domain/RES domain-containing protein